MEYRFKPYKFLKLILVCFCLVAFFYRPSTVHGAAMIDEICQPDEDDDLELKALVEEAEATGIPPKTLNRLLVRGYQDKAAARDLGRLLCIIIRAEEDGLTPDLLFAKLDEGLGKRVPFSRIISVIEEKVDDMKYAQRLISDGEEPKLEDNNVTRIAKVISAGFSRRELDRLFGDHPGASVEMCIVAAELLVYGRAIEYKASMMDRIVETGLTSQALSKEWPFLINVITKARKKNISDETVAEEAISTLSQKRSLAHLIAALGMKPEEVY